MADRVWLELGMSSEDRNRIARRFSDFLNDHGGDNALQDPFFSRPTDRMSVEEYGLEIARAIESAGRPFVKGLNAAELSALEVAPTGNLRTILRDGPAQKMAARPYQMVDCFQMLEACTLDDHTGTFNCSKPGVGKTLEAYLMSTVIALAFMNMDHVKSHSAQHAQEPARGDACPPDNPLGIRCYSTKRTRKALYKRLSTTLHQLLRLPVLRQPSHH